MEIREKDQVRIRCGSSAYNGVVGMVYEIQPASRYAIVLMPPGTERGLEGIESNMIRTQRSASEKKNPIPPGDPQWFPMEWLVKTEQESHNPSSPQMQLSLDGSSSTV